MVIALRQTRKQMSIMFQFTEAHFMSTDESGLRPNRGNRAASDRTKHGYYTNGEFPLKCGFPPIGLALSGNLGKFPEVRFPPLLS